MKTPTLTVVGAGPGDIELITLKAIKAIESAEVILYDALVNDQLLSYAAPDAELVFVGKRKGHYHYKQEEINDLIIQLANSYGHVVRLKGGDPFIFGRGAEEIDHARLHGLKTYMVPGISSALAVPAYQGIPLTKREVSESFWVITGTTKAHSLSADIALAAQSTATVVILMGMSKLREIAAIFTQAGKGQTSVAVIQNGTLPGEKVAVGKIATIEKIVRKKELKAPGIIVIGEVVTERAALDSIAEKHIKQLECIN